MSTNFYGGPVGQSFRIKKIFKNKIEMREDLLKRQSSDIAVGEFVFISYGSAAVDKDKYNELRTADKEAFDGKTYQSTLWQKIYTERDHNSDKSEELTGIENFYIDENYGLGYKLISSLVGSTPIFKEDVIVHVIPHEEDPRAGVIVEEEDSPQLELWLPRADTIHIVDAFVYHSTDYPNDTLEVFGPQVEQDFGRKLKDNEIIVVTYENDIDGTQSISYWYYYIDGAWTRTRITGSMSGIISNTYLPEGADDKAYSVTYVNNKLKDLQGPYIKGDGEFSSTVDEIQAPYDITINSIPGEMVSSQKQFISYEIDAGHIDNYTYLKCGIYANDQFWFFAHGNCYHISDENSELFEEDLNFNLSPVEVVYGNGIFLMRILNNDGDYKLMYSENGTLWNEVNFPDEISRGYKSLYFLKDKFFVIDSDQKLQYSLDGLDWKKIQGPYNSARGVAFGNNLFVLTDISSVFTSQDGINWQRVNKTFEGINYTEIFYGNGVFISYSNNLVDYDVDTTLYKTSVIKSKDGTDWTETILEQNTHTINRIYNYGDGIFLAEKITYQPNDINDRTSKLYIITDNGDTWEPVDVISKSFYNAVFGKGKFIQGKENNLYVLKYTTKKLYLNVNGYLVSGGEGGSSEDAVTMPGTAYITPPAGLSSTGPYTIEFTSSGTGGSSGGGSVISPDDIADIVKMTDGATINQPAGLQEGPYTIEFTAENSEGTSTDAKDIVYSNVTSHLTALNVQSAIDEVNSKIDNIEVPEVDTSSLVKKTDIVNNLTSTSTNMPLSAAQGKILDDKITALSESSGGIAPEDIVNNLTSTDSSKVLSAAQGKVLKDLIDSCVTLEQMNTAIQTAVQQAILASWEASY